MSTSNSSAASGARALVSSPGAAAGDIQRIVYASTATHACSDEELAQMLEKARSNNKQSAITGMLVYHEDCFLQLIEGPGPALNQLFGKLRADPRHHKVVLLLRERISERTFADWTMGFARLSSSEVQALPGMMDFTLRRMSLQMLAPRRAVMFLTAFRTNLFCASGSPHTFLGVPEA
jgi:hypothetical protein